MKKYLSGSLAILMAILFSAFARQDEGTLTQKFFEYQNLTSDGDVNNPNNYQLTPNGGATDLGCDVSTSRCQVLATPQAAPNQGLPNLTIAHTIYNKL